MTAKLRVLLPFLIAIVALAALLTIAGPIRAQDDALRDTGVPVLTFQNHSSSIPLGPDPATAAQALDLVAPGTHLLDIIPPNSLSGGEFCSPSGTCNAGRLDVRSAAITLTNNTAGVADGSWLNRTVTVGPGDAPAGSTVSTVRVTIDFDKIDAPAGNCAVGHQGGWPYNSDMVFYLTSPEGTKVVLAESYYNWGGSGGTCTTDCETYSDEDAYNGPYVIVFDDAATSAAGPAPISGTFRPAQPLSAFEGESPFGTWTLAVGDDDLPDPLCFAGFALELTAPGVVVVTDLALDKTGPATAVAGESIIYTIVVTNNGPSAAPLVEILDNLPDEVAFSDATIARSGGGPAGECAYAACQAAGVQAGEVLTMTLTGLVDPGVPDGTVLTNRATAFADDDPEPDASDSHATTVHAEADLSVDKVALADTVEPGEGLLYQIAAANAGPSDAQGVRMVDSLDPNMTFAAASPGCSYDSGTHQVACDLGRLAAGGSAQTLLAVTVGQVPGGTALTNQVSVSSDTPDPDAENNTDVETTDVVQPQGSNADLSITKVAEPAAVTAGELITYQLTIDNAGPQAATNVEVLELLPDGATVVSIAAHNPDFAYEFCTQAGACYLGTLTPGAAALITATLRVDADLPGGALTNMAAVTADEPDGAPDNNLAQATVTVASTDRTFIYLPLVASGGEGAAALPDLVVDALASGTISTASDSAPVPMIENNPTTLNGPPKRP